MHEEIGGGSEVRNHEKTNCYDCVASNFIKCA